MSDTDEVCYGYKVTNFDYTSRYGNNFKFEVSKTYEITGELKMCANGFHFCEKLYDCSMFYNFLSTGVISSNFKYFKVKAEGKILSDIGKKCCEKITLVKELNDEEVEDKIMKHFRHFNIIFVAGTYQLLINFVKKDSTLLDIIPEKYKDKKMYISALENDPGVIDILPRKYKDKEIYKITLEKDPSIFDSIPMKYLDKEMYEIYFNYIVEDDPEFIYDIPKKYHTKELWKLAFKYDPDIFTEMPDEFKDEDICNKALEYDERLVKYIPSDEYDVIIDIMID